MKNIKILFLTIFILIIITLTSGVQAAGIDGTTIVLNPRSWWRMDRLCK